MIQKFKLTLLLLLITVISFAQMKVSDHINESALGYPVTYRHYIPKVHSDFYLIFLHGSGEKGPIDGTLLDKVEVHGPPMHAKNGYEYPFHIIAPQSVGDHRNLMKSLPAYIKLKFNAKVIIVTGLSMGGYGTYDAAMYDKLCLVYAFAPVCGAGRSTLMSEYPSSMRMWHFHGDADPTVKWSTARAFINGYNDTHGGLDIETTIYPGVGHNSWSKAYSISPGQDQLTQRFIEWFNEAPVPDNSVKLDSLKAVIIDYIQKLN
jgi:predicted peptidase